MEYLGRNTASGQGLKKNACGCIFLATIASKKTIYYRDASVSLSRRRPNWVSDPVILSQRPSRSRAQGKGGRHVNRAFGDSARRSTHIAYSADLLRLTRLNSIEPGYCTCAYMKYRPKAWSGFRFENPEKVDGGVYFVRTARQKSGGGGGGPGGERNPPTLGGGAPCSAGGGRWGRSVFGRWGRSVFSRPYAHSA